MARLLLALCTLLFVVSYESSLVLAGPKFGGCAQDLECNSSCSTAPKPAAGLVNFPFCNKGACKCLAGNITCLSACTDDCRVASAKPGSTFDKCKQACQQKSGSKSTTKCNQDSSDACRSLDCKPLPAPVVACISGTCGCIGSQTCYTDCASVSTADCTSQCVGKCVPGGLSK